MIWAVFLYGPEGWTTKKADRNRIEAFEMWCWRKILGISWREHRTYESILNELNIERELMAKVACGSVEQLALTVLEGTMEGK